MISYLGISVDDLLQAFDAAFSFSDDREDREFDEAYNVEELELMIDEDLAAVEAGEEVVFDSADMSEEDFDDEDDDEDGDDVFVDDDGRLHTLGESLDDAADSLLGFLTDYVVTDSVDAEWMTLEEARGALLALRISYPEIEELPDVACAYAFSINRDPESGHPIFVSMRTVPVEDAVESLTHTKANYIGVISDDTVLDELFVTAGIPEAEHDYLGDAISEGVYALAQEQCGFCFDVAEFRKQIAAFATGKRLELVVSEDEDVTTH